MNSISLIDIVLFTKHLSVMIKSGIPLLESINILADQTKNPRFKKNLQRIEGDIKNGSPLVGAIRKFPALFSPLYVSMIAVGEQTGTLDEVLVYLAIHLKKQYDFKKKVQSALLYPEIIMVTALIVGTGISIFVLPQLIDLFESLNVTLPMSTQLLLSLAHFMKVNGVIFFLGIFGILGLLQALIKLPLIRPLWDKLVLSLPLIGGHLNEIEMASFCRNLGMMLKSGLPILSAFDILASSTTNEVYKRSIHDMYVGIKQGSTLYKTIETYHMTHIPVVASRMIQVGEKTGNLDETLLYLGDFFEEGIDAASKDFATVLEPLILVVVGLIVAFLSFAIISPIYEFSSGIK